MGRKLKQTPGLIRIGEIWHIDKRIGGRRLCESTGERNRQKAETYLARRIEEFRQATVYGVRPTRTWRQAATHYLNTVQKPSLDRDAQDLRTLDPHIGDLPLRQVHMGSLAPFIRARYGQGVKASTINRSLAVLRRVLNLAARLWRDDQGMTWLETPPMIVLEPVTDARAPYPLSWDEQHRLLQELPAHLARMVLFKVNTGLREREVSGLRWEWEIPVPELNTSVFLIPGRRIKNREDRLVVLNRVAKSVIEGQRGKHPASVFTFRGQPVQRIRNSAWRAARCRAGLSQVRVHDLKHTFGRRLRAAGVSLETRKVLLGHTTGDVTTHYSAPELAELIEAAERVVGTDSRKTPELVVLRLREQTAGFRHPPE